MGKTELGKMEFGNGMEDADNPDPLFLENRCLRSYLETAPMAVGVLLGDARSRGLTGGR